MRLSRPFIRLPLQFDAERMAHEVAALPESAWMPHPSGMKGNTAVALVSRDGEDNDDFDGAMAATPHLQACPVIRQSMAGLGEVLGRSRLMRLAPGCEVSLHVDFNYHWVSRVRMHIPLVTNPNVQFFCGDRVVHMQPGECWLFDSWRRHRVVNGGDADRVHLVIDTSGSARFWQMVRAADSATPPAPQAVPPQANAGSWAEPGAKLELHTERYNTAPVMAPGELDGLIAEIVAEFSAHPGNDLALVREYRELLFDFGRDWRATWHRHGYLRRGWPEYRKLLDGLKSGLHADPRALVTGSNEIGINPIIMQRIVRPALATERFDQVVAEAASTP